MTDIEHFEVFMRNYQDMVYSTAVRLLGNETDAQDIAQTVFLKAYDFFGSLAQSKTAGGWLKTVTTNLCLNHLTRYRARWRFFSELRRDEDDADFLESVPAPDTMTPDLDESDDRRLLETALHKLPEAQRMAIVLRRYDDISYEEIGEILDLSVPAVKSVLFRARTELREKLKQYLDA